MRAPRRLILPHPRQHGFTLVELLVTVTLGLLVIAGIGQIYTAAKRSYDIQTSLARLQDAGRYAVDTITQDVRRAGYWGLTNMRAFGPPAGAAPTAATCNNTWGSMAQQTIFGINDSTAGYACITGVGVRGDVLTARYADPQPTAVFAANALYIRTTPTQASITAGPPAGAPGPISSDHAVTAHAYYVRNSTTATCNGAAIPALIREELDANGLPQAAELVLGVEHLQFQFGIDSDGDRSVNQYVNANALALANWNNVVSVRFWVLARDECPETGYTNTATYAMGDINYTVNDQYRRQLYTSTVALRN
ncbi:MAG: PilW family protein [Pseudomonadota bacterium]